MASNESIWLMQVIAQLLENNGWKRSVGDRVLTRMFQGCNHEHQAITRLLCQNGCRPSVILMGSFDSEGRNVLASAMTLVSYGNHPEVSRKVMGYISHAEKLVGESYSVSLYRRFGMHPDRPALPA